MCAPICCDERQASRRLRPKMLNRRYNEPGEWLDAQAAAANGEVSKMSGRSGTTTVQQMLAWLRSRARMTGADKSSAVLAPALVELSAEDLALELALGKRLDAAVALARGNKLPDPALVLGAIGLPALPVGPNHRLVIRALAAAHPAAMAELSFAGYLRPLRPEIVEALGAARDPSAASCLAVHSADSDSRVRLAALRAACEIADPTAARWTAQLLADPAEAVVVKAIHTCVVLGTIAALPQLEALTQHRSWWVRTRASAALGALAQHGAAIAGGARAA